MLLVEREGAVATLIMNRPKTRNALDPELLQALAAGLQAAASDDSVRAVVLTGAGDAFCSGADLKGALGDLEAGAGLGPRIEQFHELIRAIVSAPKPFIAAVRGPAVGFGADLALACDLRVLAEDAYIQEKFVAIGLMPDGGGSFWLPRLVGLGRALKNKLGSAVKVFAVEPANSAVLSGKPAGMHGIQGLGAGFVPQIVDRSIIDNVLEVTDVAAERMARRLAREEGLLVGPSSGANVHAACEVAAQLKGGNVVTILCDSGERYLF